MTLLNLPAVTIFSLGGTIAATTTADPDAGVTPQLTADDFLTAIPQINTVAQINPIAFRGKSSSDLTVADIVELTAAIEQQRASGVNGIVVTQGTDTIEETSFALDLLLPPGPPVVVTGAMRNPTLPGADGPANLLAAVRVAASPAARDLGVLVVINDEVHTARFVRKSHTTSPASFLSPSTGRIGWITEDRVHIGLVPAQPMPPLPAPVNNDLPPVALLRMALDPDATMLAALPDLGYRGLVIEGFGGGHIPGALAPVAERVALAMPVVLASRTGSGETLQKTYGTPGCEIDLLRRGLIPAGFLDGPKARIALILLLAAGHDAAAISTYFTTINSMR